jgi:hypothetical protein
MQHKLKFYETGVRQVRRRVVCIQGHDTESYGSFLFTMQKRTGNELRLEIQADRRGGEAEWKMRSQGIKEKWIRRSKFKEAKHRPG